MTGKFILQYFTKEGRKKIIWTEQFEVLITAVIALTFFLVPVFFSGWPVAGMGFEKSLIFYGLTLIGLAAWVTKGIVQGEIVFKKTVFDWPIVFFIIVAIASTLFSVSMQDSFLGYYGNPAKGLLAIFCYATFYYLLVNNIDTKRAKIYFWSIFASIIIISLYSLLQILGIYTLPFLSFTKYINFNPFGNISALAIFSVVTLPVLVVLAGQTSDFCAGKSKCVMIVKSIATIFTVVVLAMLFLIHNFVFWPAAIVSLVVILMFYLSKIINISKTNLAISGATFFFLIVFLVINNFNWLNLDFPSEFSLSRGLSWQIAKQSLKADPLLGSGVATFYEGFTKYRGQDFNTSYLWNNKFDNASGVWFESLASIGAIGTLALLLLFITLLSNSYKALINEKDKTMQAIMLALFSGFIGITILSALFAFTAAILLYIILFMTLIAALTGYLTAEDKTLVLTLKASPQHALALAAIFLSLSAGVIFLLVMGARFYVADVFAGKSILAENSDTKLNYINKSLQLNPYQAEYYSYNANYYFDLANQEAQGAKDQKKIADLVNSAVSSAKKAVELANSKPESHIALGLIYENSYPVISDGITLASEQYKKAQEIDPTSPLPYFRIANLEALKVMTSSEQSAGQQPGQPAQAADPEKEKVAYEAVLKLYDEAINRKKDYGDAYYGKATIYGKLGKNDEAISNLELANSYSPNNITYLYDLGVQYSSRGLAKVLSAQKDKTKPLEKAISLASNKDLAGAEQIFKTIVTQEPKHENAYYNLAMLYYKTGNKDNAKKSLNSLLDLIADENTKKEIKKQFPGI